MYVANAHKRTKHSKSKDDSPATAGVAKTSGGYKTAQELKALGERSGWVAGPITPEHVKAMGADQLRWNELFNNENLEHALALPETNKQYDKTLEQRRALRFWHNIINLNFDEQTAFRAEFQKFVDTYPQFRGAHAEENTDVLTTWLQDRQMTPIYANLCLAFEACALAGKLWLNPSAISAGQESETHGTQHHNFHLLIQPQRRNTDDGLSADAFLAQHSELHDTRTPPIIIQRQQVAAATAAHFEQAKSGTAEGQAVRFTDMGGKDYSGYPSHPTKYSFRRLLDSLDSVEYQRRLNADPAFAAAVDKLNNGNR